MNQPAVRRFSLWLGVVIVLTTWTVGAVPGPPAAKRPMELADILAWKSVSMTLVSTDGRWFAYRVAPLDGDAEIVIRQIQGEKQYKFVIGDSRGGGGSFAFSEDARWAALVIAPTKKEAAQLRKTRKPLQNKVALVDLSTGTDVKFEKVRRFAFSGEKAGWIALQKYGPEGAGGGAPGAAPAGAPAPPPPAGGGASSAADDRPKGADLILHELATGAELNVGNVSEFAFNKAGTSLALVIDAQDKSGNGIELRNMDTGVLTSLDTAKASYERLAWTEKGDGLSALRSAEDKRYKDKVYAIVAFTGFAGAAPQKTVYDPATDKTFPEGMGISPTGGARWTEDLGALTFGIRAPKKADPKAEAAKPDPNAPEAKPATPPAADDTSDEEKPDLILWHWQDPRLQSQQQVQEEMDKNFSYLCLYRVADKTFLRLADDTVRTVSLAPKERWAVGIDVREYELESNLSGRSFRDVYTINLQTGERKLALKKARDYSGPSTDGNRLLYFEDGHFWVYDMASGQSTNLTKAVPASFINTEDDHNVAKPPRRSLGWTKDGDAVLLSDGWDIWKVPVSGASVNLTGNGKKESIRYQQILRLDPEERGYDLSVPRYVTTFGELTKKGGIVRLEPGKSEVQVLQYDDAMIGGVTKAKRADVYVYSRQTYKNPGDYYVTDASLEPGTKITSMDAQVEAFDWSAGSMLVNYVGARGDKLQGSLSLPANYEKGKAYPTIVYMYEKLTNGHNQFATPTANGFNKSVYTSNGYAVLMPDITFKLNDPGTSSTFCILAALKAAIATGVVDPKHVGITGHSWGGYQTAFIVTQTNAFAAAVAGAPLTNMVSMYSLIYKNSGGSNGAIFETSQGRFLGGPWDNWESYIRNSPVNAAKNVTTPLVILHNDKDGAVDFTQGVEYYNTLRRMGKQVVMLEYPGENHGLAKPANQQDYTVRMKEFFDHYLKGKPAPDWWTKGVPRLQMEDHLKQRLDDLKKAKAIITKPTEPASPARK
jgi:dipeptidyl aminopeptidase/acylaminoacyl peptidase